MKSILEDKFTQTFSEVNDPNSKLGYDGNMREFFIETNVEHVVSVINFCPWSGAAYPESLRNKLFDILESMNLEYYGGSEIPSEFMSEEWWISRGL